MARFTQTPEYQRRAQRLRRKTEGMPSAERTMMEALAMELGGEEMRKKVRSTQMATEKKRQAKSLELGERGLGLRRKGFEFAKKQILPSTLIGLGEVGLGVYGGIERRKMALESARTTQELSRWLLSQRTPQPFTEPGSARRPVTRQHFRPGF